MSKSNLIDKAIFILWDEQAMINLHHEYIGGGEYKVVGNEVTVTKRARWSNTVSKYEIYRAKEYARKEMNDGRANVRVEVLGD